VFLGYNSGAQMSGIGGGNKKMKTLRFHEISDFERVQFSQKLQEELETLNEIQGLLEDSLPGDALPSSEEVSEFYRQRAKTLKLQKDVESKLHQIEVEKHLKMLTISLKDIKKLQKDLSLRIVKKIDSTQTEEQLLFLQDRLEEEVLQEEWGIKTGFKSFPVTPQELEFLLSV
jgi:hypothetical protein